MPQHIRRDDELPLSPAALVERLRDPAVVEGRSAADGLGTRVVEHEATADGVRIVVATALPVDWLPAVVRGRLTQDPTVERTEEWTVGSDGATSPLHFDFPGMPVTGTGAARLTPTPGGAHLTVEVDVTVDVPLVGGLVEGAVAPRVGAALDAESAFYRTLGAPDTDR
jgi:hypothetical protein